MGSDDVREQFLAWCKTNADSASVTPWAAWQASRAALAVAPATGDAAACVAAVGDNDTLPAVNEVMSFKADDPIRSLNTAQMNRVVRLVCAAVEVQRRNDVFAIRDLPLPATATAVEEARKAFYEAARGLAGELRLGTGPVPATRAYARFQQTYTALLAAEAAATHAATESRSDDRPAKGQGGV